MYSIRFVSHVAFGGNVIGRFTASFASHHISLYMPFTSVLLFSNLNSEFYHKTHKPTMSNLEQLIKNENDVLLRKPKECVR